MNQYQHYEPTIVTVSSSFSYESEPIVEPFSSTHYQKGDKIGGYFQVYKVKKGGMSEVYLCEDIRTGVICAAKTIKAKYLTDPNRRKLFNQEVSTWIALEKHPNIVRCLALEIVDNLPFIFLEWISGGENQDPNLCSWLREKPLELRLALDFTIDICRGLIYANQKQPGIVHCDLKPGNILINQDKTAKITDFGLARIISGSIESDSGIQNRPKGRFMGTPEYAAPEQWRGEKVDTRTDIYAIGCILYEMLTKRKLFEVSKELKREEQHKLLRIHHEQTSPPTLPSTFSEELNEIIQICLQKERTARFATQEQLLQELTILYQQLFSQSPKVPEVSDEFTAGNYNDRGNTYRELGRYDDALKEYTQAIYLNPNYAVPFYNRGLTYEDLHQYENALTSYAQVIKLAPDSILAYTTYTKRAEVYIELQRYKEALADCSKVVQLEPSNAIAYNNRGVSYYSLHRYKKALEDFTKAIEFEPNNIVAYEHRAQTHRNLKQYEEALKDYNQVIQLTSQFPEENFTNLRFFTMHFLSEIEYCEIAETSIKEVSKIPMDSIPEELPSLQRRKKYKTVREIKEEAYNNRGYIYFKLQKIKEAITDFTRAIKLNPNLAGAYYNRGIAYSILRQNKKALEDYKQAVQLAPNYAGPYYKIGVLYYKRGKFQKALPHLEKAVQLGFLQGTYFVAQAKRLLETSKQHQKMNKKKKMGRNDPCPCGSGLKYKKCCLSKQSL